MYSINTVQMTVNNLYDMVKWLVRCALYIYSLQTELQITQLAWMQELTPSEQKLAEEFRADIEGILQSYIPGMQYRQTLIS